ncbi:MAG: class I SAM-dependent methyltransferase [Planctomycetota bacterium]|jgi:phospholipid N-methyltransferase
MRVARFIFESLKHPKQIGTFTESSKFLAKKMVQEIDGTINVIEFGSGTGAVTLEILRRLPKNGRLTCFEINSNFCKCLEGIEDSRLKVVNDDAQNCEQYVDGLDCIVSGLPLSLLAKSQRERILDIASKSKRYIQLQYTPLLRKKMRNYFSDVKIKFVPLNFPPAFIYICKAPLDYPV